MRSILFKAGMSFKNRRFLGAYKSLEYECDQAQMLQDIMKFTTKHVPYYSKFENINELSKFPILTKSDIKQHYNDFYPDIIVPGVPGKTGGSTGEPLSYRMSPIDEITGLALMYRGWGYAGYQMGDSIAQIAGSSLIPMNRNCISDIKAFILNEYRFSSFDLSDEKVINIISKLNSAQPKFVRGYASSLNYIARYMLQHGLTLVYSPEGIFSTAEMLYDDYRRDIEAAFGAKVYNQYGLNDGGVSAYECEHGKMHIDEHRALMESVDGKIIATGLLNRAFPFIRYDTGDIGYIANAGCTCGRPGKILTDLMGRSCDFISLPDGTKIHSEFFAHIFWEVPCRKFQVSQDGNVLMIDIVPWDKPIDTNFITNCIMKRCIGMKLVINLVDKIETRNKTQIIRNLHG